MNDDINFIINITAIVGQNGSGKSTLIDELIHLIFNSGVNNPCFVRKWGSDPFGTDVKNLIIINENGTLHCYHNLKSLEISNVLNNIKIVNYNDRTQGIEGDYFDNKGIYSFTKIAFSNSNYTYNDTFPNIRFLYDNIDGIFINPNLMKYISGVFYARRYKYLEINTDREYVNYIERCRNGTETNDFQKLLDIYYLYKWSNDLNKTDLLDFFEPSLKIRFKSSNEYFDGNVDNYLAEQTRLMTRQMILYYPNVSELYIDLLTEVLLRFGEYKKISVVKSYNTVNELVDDLKRLGDRNKWISDCLDEIELLKKILEEVGVKESSDSECDYLIQSLSDAWRDFLKFMSEVINGAKDSFVLRYMDIAGLTFSSGESLLYNIKCQGVDI